MREALATLDRLPFRNDCKQDPVVRFGNNSNEVSPNPSRRDMIFAECFVPSLGAEVVLFLDLFLVQVASHSLQKLQFPTNQCGPVRFKILQTVRHRAE